MVHSLRFRRCWDGGPYLKEVGVYSAAFRVFEISYVLPAATMSIALPHLSHARAKSSSHFHSEVRRVGLMMAVLALVWTVILMGGAPWIVNDLFWTRLSGVGWHSALPRDRGRIGGIELSRGAFNGGCRATAPSRSFMKP